MSLQSSIKKTRSFTREGFKYNCPHDYKQTPYTINLDWFQLNCTFGITEAEITNEIHNGYIDREFIRLQINGGDKHFKYILKAIYEDNEVATLQVIPRNPGKDEQQTMLLKLENHVLYSNWHEVYYQLKKALNFTVNKFSRVDIAIDGLSIHNLMNDNLKGTLQAVKMIGKSVVKGHDLNRTKKIFHGWTVGTPKGNKLISMYNKSKDIARTNKNYISDFWTKNNLPQDEPIHRFEMRLKNGFLKRIYSRFKEENELISEWNRGDKTEFEDIFFNQDMDLYIKKLTNANFLLKLVNLGAKNLLEFIYMDDKNVTRCTRVNYLPQSAHPMQYIKKDYTGIGYKNKMLVHATVIDALKMRISPDLAVQIIEANLQIYELTNYYASNYQKWLKKYQITPKPELKPLYDECKRKLLTVNQLHTKVKTYQPIIV